MLGSSVSRPSPKSGIDHDAAPRAAQSRGHLEVGAVDAQHQLGAGFDRRADLGRIEAVDADPHAGGAELAHDVAQRGKGHARGAADVDDVGAAGAEVLGGGADLLRAVSRGRC